jgi:predicted RNA-binding protein with TRAM domain
VHKGEGSERRRERAQKEKASAKDGMREDSEIRKRGRSGSIIVEPAVHRGFVVLVPEVLEGRRQRNGQMHLTIAFRLETRPKEIRR